VGVGPLERTCPPKWAPCFRLSFAAAGAYCRNHEIRGQIFDCAGDRAGFEDGAETGQNGAGGEIDRVRESDPEDRIPLLVARAHRIGIGSAADFEIATREVAGAGEVDFGEASIRHGGVSGAAAERGQREVFGLAGGELFMI